MYVHNLDRYVKLPNTGVISGIQKLKKSFKCNSDNFVRESNNVKLKSLYSSSENYW